MSTMAGTRLIISKPDFVGLFTKRVGFCAQHSRCLSSTQAVRCDGADLEFGFSSVSRGGQKFRTQTANSRCCHQPMVLTNLSSSRRLSTQVSSSPAFRPYVDPKNSYAFGRSNENLIYSTIAHELDKQVEALPDSVAFVSHYENKEATFKQLDHDVNMVSKALVKQFNIKQGDAVAIFAYNCYNWAVLQFACARVGAILVPINPSYKSSELSFVLKSCKAKCLFMPGPKSVQTELNDHLKVLQSNQTVDMTKADELELRDVIFMDQNHEYKISTSGSGDGNGLSIETKLANCEFHNWSETQNDGLVFRSAQEADDAGISEADACVLNRDLLSPDDVSAVFYTSGTTGKPKGACVTHFTVINNVRFCQLRLRQGRPKNWRTICCTALPMFHVFAGVLNNLSPVVSNSVTVYSSYKYDIATVVEAIAKYKANMTTLTPTVLIDMLSYIETNKITDCPLKIIQSGGAALSPEVVSRTFKIIPGTEEVRTGFGSTENGAVATLQTIHEPNELRPFTVGQPLDFTEIRIVEPNTGSLMPLGKTGEIQTRGYNTMLEYLNQPDKTAEVVTPNRWYRTGDMGLMHPHGSIQICGRFKNIIIKGGENIYPEEVEQLIHKLDYVEDVHVVGVPDKRFGEQICAWIKLKPGYSEAKEPQPATGSKQIHENDIISFCKENITYFKVPKYYLFVKEFPMTSTKKVQSNMMTMQSVELLGLQDQVS